MKKHIKTFIATLVLFSGASALFPPIFKFLSLSWSSFFPTQLLTFVLASKESLSFGWAFDLLFSACVLGFSLSALLMRLSLKELSILIVTSMLFVGGCSLGLMVLTGSAFVLAGPAPLIYCLLTALLMSDEKLKVFLFGLLPVEPRLLVTVLLGLNIIHNLSISAYMQIAADLSGVIFALAYAKIFFKTPWPFSFRKKKSAPLRGDKIIEIHDWTSSDGPEKRI